MPTIRQFVDKKTIQAYGTSEGGRKAWDTRGRGRHKKPSTSNKSRIGPSSTIRILPVEEHTQEHTQELTKAQIVSRYEKLGDALSVANKKLDDPEEVKSLAGRLFHVGSLIGEHYDNVHNFKELAIDSLKVIGKVFEMIAGVGTAGYITHAAAQHLVNAYHHIGPAVAHMALSLGAGADPDYKSGHSSLRAMVDGKSIQGVKK